MPRALHCCKACKMATRCLSLFARTRSDSRSVSVSHIAKLAVNRRLCTISVDVVIPVFGRRGAKPSDELYFAIYLSPHLSARSYDFSLLPSQPEPPWAHACTQ